MEIERQVNHPSFKMFFAVHELEAWLLSQPEIFSQKDLRDAITKRTKNNPEIVDLDTPPKRLLNDLFNKYKRTGYKENIDGRNYFEKLDPNIVYEKCPHFKELMDAMLAMAKQ